MSAHQDKPDSKVVSVRFPLEVLEKTERVAQDECRTLSGHLRFLVKRDLEERGEKSWSQ